MKIRRAKFIYPAVQLRVVLIALSVAAAVLLVNFQLTFSRIWATSAGVPDGANASIILDALGRSVLNRFLISVGLAIPLAAVVGILFSFKFAGPLYRFRAYFLDLKSGRLAEPCHLRRGDDLQELCTAINEAMEGVRSLLGESQAVLRDVRTALEEKQDDRAGRTRQLLARVTQVERTISQRLSPTEPPRGQQLPPQGPAQIDGALERQEANTVELQS